MKRLTDPRHRHRIKVVQELYTWDLAHDNQAQDPTTNQVIKNLDQIDQLISSSAPERPISQIAKMDLAILRLATYELVIDKSQPEKVVIDEAVELGKQFGTDSSSSFINGALGHITQDIKHKTEN